MKCFHCGYPTMSQLIGPPCYDQWGEDLRWCTECGAVWSHSYHGSGFSNSKPSKHIPRMGAMAERAKIAANIAAGI